MWKCLLENFNEACDMLKKKENCATDDLIYFRSMPRDFYFKYFVDIGLVSVTNYLHILG